LIINSYHEDSVSNTLVAGYRLRIATARTTVNTTLASLRSVKQNYLDTEASSVSSSDDQLQGVLLQEQRVKSAEAGVNAVYAQIEKSIIRAPFDGVVTKIEAEVGEIISANTPIVSLMSKTKFEIETFVPEADIADVKIGNTANLTLDAYGSDVSFGASVSFIDPAETIIEGVATYKVILNFNEDDERILSGMTANVDIVTDTSKDALAIPQRAVIEKDGRKFVKVVRGDETAEVEVKTGLRDFNGDIEILDGLNEGDEIVVFSRE
jgi:RND family efflux transporter MFP subunit